MMSWPQVKFLMRETARSLAEGGMSVVTFRDFDRLLARRAELDSALFVRYIYGNHLYYGSQRRSCWTPQWLIDVASQYHLRAIATDSRGMNSTVTFVREAGSLRKFSPEPVLHFNVDGSIRNEADDFHYSDTEHLREEGE
jgi:hypothetical protein